MIFRQAQTQRQGRGSSLYLPKWHNAYANTQAQNSDSVICFLGDSTTMGSCAGVPSTTTSGYGGNGFALSWPSILSSLILNGSYKNFSAAHGIENVYSGANLRTQAKAHDTRCDFGSNWSASIATTFGGAMWGNSDPNTDVLTFTLSGINTFKVSWQRYTGSGDWAWDIDGGGYNTVVGNGVPSAFVETTIAAGSVGTHTLSLKRTGGGTVPTGPVSFGLIRGYNSSVKEVRILNGGIGSVTIGGLISSSNPWDYQNALTSFAPNLVIIMCTINDCANGTSLDNFTTRTQTAITFALNAGADVLLVSGIPSSPTIKSDAIQQTYRDVYTSLGVTNHIPVLHINVGLKNYANGITAGYYDIDGKHYNSTGYTAIANWLLPYLSK